MRVLIDGDILAYRAAASPINDIDVINGGWVSEQVARFSPGSRHDIRLKNKLHSLVTPIIKKFPDCEYAMILSDPNRSNQFRHKMKKDIDYKGNRPPPPAGLGYCKSILESYYLAGWAEGLEGDDLLGIFQDDNTIIASIDKDMRMIPGLHYNFDQDRIFRVSDPGNLKLYRGNSKVRARKIVGGGFKWFCAQMLIGDTSDGIPGLKGIGPVSAYKYLNDSTDERSMWHIIETLYREQDQYHRLHETADMLWILREQDKTWRDIL